MGIKCLLGILAKLLFGELELEASEKLQQLKRLLGWRAIALQGKKPSGLVAAMIYIIAKQKGLNVTQMQLSGAFNISENLIYCNRKLIETIVQDLSKRNKE